MLLYGALSTDIAYTQGEDVTTEICAKTAADHWIIGRRALLWRVQTIRLDAP